MDGINDFRRANIDRELTCQRQFLDPIRPSGHRGPVQKLLGEIDRHLANYQYARIYSLNGLAGVTAHQTKIAAFSVTPVQVCGLASVTTVPRSPDYWLVPKVETDDARISCIMPCDGD